MKETKVKNFGGNQNINFGRKPKILTGKKIRMIFGTSRSLSWSYWKIFKYHAVLHLLDQFSRLWKIKHEQIKKIDCFKNILRIMLRLSFPYLTKFLYLVSLVSLEFTVLHREGVCLKGRNIVWFSTFFNTYKAFWRDFWLQHDKLM